MAGGLVVIATVVAPGCETEPTPQEIVTQYAEAVQQRNLNRLYCLSAGAAGAEELGQDEAQRRESFEAWADAQYMTYEDGRDLGHVELDGNAIPLVKLLALGSGTFSSLDAPRAVGTDGRVLTAQLRFGYDQIDLSRYSPGTTLYFNGSPVGKVRPLQIPQMFRRVSLDVLETVSVMWTLVQQPAVENCPAGWKIVSVEPVNGSERSTSISWEF